MKPSNKICMVPKVFFRRRLENGYSVARDGLRRSLVTGIVNTFNGNAVESIAYSYDALGRPVARNNDAFGYNDRSEVTSASIMGWSPSPSTASYGYDDIGNLLVSSFNAATNAYTANSLNQYTSILCDSVTLCEPTYDTDGNMLSDGVLSFTYDAASRLKTVSSNGVTLVTNFYDAKSRRVKKVTPNATTTFFYDDWNLVEERIAYADNMSSTIRYYWGKDLSGTLQGAGGVGGLLWLTVDGTIYIPCYDNNGNVTRYLNANGGTFARYSYDAFGRLIARVGRRASFFRHRFSTKYYDTETGLYYYGYRFYHPGLMRWLNRDPIEENGGINVYSTCNNLMLYSIDPLGLKMLFITVGESSPKPGFEDTSVQKLAESFSVIDKMLSDLEKVSDVMFESAKNSGSVKFNNKPFNGTKSDYIRLLQREKQSRHLMSTIPGREEVLKKLKEMVLEADQEYDEVGIAVHGVLDRQTKIPLGEMSFSGVYVSTSKSVGELRKIGRTSKGKFYIISCYRTWDGKTDVRKTREGLTILQAKGKVGFKYKITRDSSVENSEITGCSYVFYTPIRIGRSMNRKWMKAEEFK